MPDSTIVTESIPVVAITPAVLTWEFESVNIIEDLVSALHEVVHESLPESLG